MAVLFASSVAVALASCAPSAEETTSAETNGSAAPSLTVMTTILPITQFTNAVVGDRADVVPVMPTTINPHDFQASPADVQALANADVLVKNGLGMEAFLDDLMANAENPNLVVIDSSQGIATLSNEAIEGQDHSEEFNPHNHSEEFNPHIWLDPKRVIQQVENIRDGMIAVDPAGRDIYTANAAAFIAELEALDAEISKNLAPYAGQTFVAFHDFAPYFAESYNLQAEFLVDLPAENPSPEDVKRVMDTVRDSQLKTILTEPSAGEESFTTIAKDLNIQVGLFNPLEVGGPEAVQPDYYLATMRDNMANLVTSFEGAVNGSTRSWWSEGLPALATVVPKGGKLGF
jgi:zinc/manganese transport system substrate-binding protein